MNAIQRERQTVRQMIEIYCRYKEGNRPAFPFGKQTAGHAGKSGLCPSCQELLQYAEARLGRCPFGEQKPTCRRCPIHCYKPDMKQRIQAVMRYAGPRMLFFHPIAALRHLLHR